MIAATRPSYTTLTTSSTAHEIASATHANPASATALGEPEQIVLHVPPEHDAVVRDGRGQQRGGTRGEEQVGHVEAVLLGIERGEQRGERHGEQEAEEHLHAEACDPELLEQLDQVAVDALRFALVTSPRRFERVVGRAHGSFVPRRDRR